MVTRREVSKALADDHFGYRQAVSFALGSKDLEARFAFGKHFHAAEAAASDAIAVALTMLSLFWLKIEDNEKDRLRVLGVTFTALNLQLSSLKLFMSGHTVAAGSLFRQVIEGVSLGFLFSVRSLDFLARFEAGQYTANSAVWDLVRHARDVHFRKAAIKTLLDAYRFYHTYAHLSKLTIAATANFSLGGAPHLGSLYDQDKLPEYAKEVRGRVSFARVMPNAVYGICRNLATW
jgi:hypothetical protein